ncbi:MAG: UDP-N-acetylmuramoyl-L-alanyl-D-glutamate--2,6-diaminopimelate ligase [Clostridia bacterium]|nr:UDP-N-acetylmuramoyl-L-alanyl-D-glutamate--2,6-diaminopimelate ligase [Clostridia bacterium]
MHLKQIAELFINNKLTTDIPYIPEIIDEFKHISCDSRDILPNTLFFAKGVNFKREYLLEAIPRGVTAYISEIDLKVSIPFIKVNNVRLAMPLTAKYFYNNPSSKYKLTGITGTKGKTTCAYMLKSILTLACGEEKVGIISTNEALSGMQKIKKTGTTPEALELYGILNTFVKDGIETAVMEVSSQGLQYNRIEYIDYFIGIFLNLSPDHISPTEHKNFDEYKHAKMRMLTLCKNGIVNVDDEHSSDIIKAATCQNLYTVGINKDADFIAKNIILSKNGVSFEVFGKYINGEIFELTMPGEFNIYNALSAIVAAWLLKVDIQTIKEGLAGTTIKGRMEILEQEGKIIIVDYAHNSLSFNAVFDYVKTFYPDSDIICVFGCQGNKALGRRKELPEIAGKRASFIVLTSDDPANEDPEVIMDEIEITLKKTDIKYIKITDRERAVKYAVSMAKTGDVVILAGKGHETSQQVKGQSEFYKGDMLCAKEALNEYSNI